MTIFRHFIPRRMTSSMLRPFTFGRLRPFHLIASTVGRRRKLIHANATSPILPLFTHQVLLAFPI